MSEIKPNETVSDITEMTESRTEPAMTCMDVKKTGQVKMRLRALIVLIGVSALIGTSIYLDPERLESFDPHYALLKPCSMLVKYGYPCPTCYMTRSFAYMYHGRPDKAFAAQPFGAAMALMTAYLGYGAIYVLIRGKGWNPFWARWSRKWFIVIFIAAFLAGWGFKIGYGTFISHEFPLVRQPNTLPIQK
ncbi:MAG: DUF2752 domain-containing protein [Phycisphaerae bacterium]|nr:DUF2752 domain-containing protein [Phycisphaerae bacterium]